jgi:cytoskeletal protein CcmA (bactofilin family)
MGATYTRQSSYTDGDVIQAADTNNEFDQLLAAFAAGTGHTHDGTAAEGGPVTKMLGTSLTLGDGTAGTDITVTFDGESNDGVIKWMEDEDYFEFSDDILVASTEKLQFRDTAIYINSSADGQLDLVADTEIQIAATTIDINGNVDISGTLTIGGAGISEAELEILDGATVTTTEINILDGDTSASATTVVDADRVVFNDAGTMKQVAVTDLAAYFDDEITAMPNLVTTAATTVGALNSGSITSGFGTIDTGSSTITTTGLITGGSLDIDDVVINGTTIGHTDDTDLLTVASGLLTVAGEVSMTTLDIGGTNVTATATELNYSDTGASVGTVVASKVVTVDANKDVASFRNITLTGELDAGSLDVSGDADIDGTLEADAITIAGVTLAETISDTVGAMVSSNTETGISVSYDDSDNTLDFVLGTAQTTIESVKNTSLVIGRDDDNLIKFSTDNQIIFEVSGGDNVIFKASGEIEASSLDISGDADIDGTLEADAITVNGTALNTVIAGVTVANATLAATTTVTDSTANTNFPVVFHDESNALLDDTGALRYNPSTGELLVPKLTVAGTTTTVDTVTMNAENAIIFEGATADAHETTLTIVDPTADRTINLPNQSGTLPVLAAASNTAITSTPAELNILDGATVVVGEINALDLGSTAVGNAIASKAVILDSNKDYTGIRNFTITGELDAGSLDVSGDADIDGTLEADAITVNGTALATVIAGTTVTNATNSAHVLVTDNENTNEENLIAFVEDATSSTGNVGLEMDGDFSYNPSTGTVTATIFKGNIDAVDGDFDGTLEADAITVGGATLNSVIADEATALAIALG